jgi:xanthine/CO dehydrogenase XdhC/CoxF family maturation factor
MQGLQSILATLAALTEPAALATLVRTKGSSYRRPGARMVFLPSGAQWGTISAGCLETDVKARVLEVLRDGQPQVVAYDLGNELDLIWGTGMGCQGVAEILLEPIRPGVPAPWAELCAGHLAHRRAGAQATVFGARGTHSFPLGTRFLQPAPGGPIHPDGAELTPSLALAMAEVLRTGASAASTFQVPGGAVDLLVEPILPPYALWIFGAGEHARPLARIAKGLGWTVGLVDHRPALATPERFPEADHILVGQPGECVRDLPLDARSAALVVSHVYDKDKEALGALLKAPLGYLGLQGNRRRSERLVRELAQEGLVLTPAQEAIFHWPAGLDLGAEAPEAIALSMVAEAHAALAGHSGGHLREAAGRILGQFRPTA